MLKLTRRIPTAVTQIINGIINRQYSLLHFAVWQGIFCNYGDIMKETFKKIMVILMASFILFSLCSCVSVDPNVKQESKKTTKYKIVTTKPSDVNTEEFNAYGDGLTDSVMVKGVKVDVNAYALRSYELAYLIGTSSFKSANKMSADALVQYSFAHLYYDDLYKIPRNGAVYKETSLKKIKNELEKHFGKLSVNLKKSSLYNKGNKRFEMWLPEYGNNVYYRIDAANVSGDKVEIITTFYNESKKSTKLGRTTLTVKVKKGKAVIASLSKD